jgi:hypothetical protein
VLHVKSEAEKAREARDREVTRIMDGFKRAEEGPGITRGEDTVDIAGVKLPIRKIK